MKRTQLFTLASLMIASSGLASATTITFQGLDAARSAQVWMNFTYLAGDLMLNGNTASSTTSVNEQIGVGVLNIAFDGSLQLQDAFCVDRFRYISNGNYTVNVSAPSTVTNGARAAWLLHDILPQINAAPVGTQQRNLAAALQMAIWDIIQDGGDGFTAGRIRQSTSTNALRVTDPIILSLANTFITRSNGQAYTNALVLNNVNVNSYTQRLIVDQGVPEPSTWALALTGLLWAGIRRAKRV